MSREARTVNVCSYARTLAPAFRDKFDFGQPEDYDKLADMAFLAAEAMQKKEEALMIRARAEDEKEVK